MSYIETWPVKPFHALLHLLSHPAHPPEFGERVALAFRSSGWQNVFQPGSLRIRTELPDPSFTPHQLTLVGAGTKLLPCEVTGFQGGVLQQLMLPYQPRVGGTPAVG